jgi:GNAT superfamily N-acetyltransferase
MNQIFISKTEIRYADPDADTGACYVLMRQLRPHLTSESEFAERWRRQCGAGYRMMGLWLDGKLVCLAGFRVIENLVHGVHLYVDDLVTSEEARGRGAGAGLLRRLQEEARALGCAKLLLDTQLSNALAHRFYYRNGLLATALRFAMAVAS